MIFQVIRKSDNKGMFKTNTAELPYSATTLKQMEISGYAFKVDGKSMSASNVIKAFSETGDTRQAAPAIAANTVSTTYIIRCIETGETWRTQALAARALNIDPAQVSDSIKTGRKRSGYTFEKVAVEND